jgi:hypothetical protein
VLGIRIPICRIRIFLGLQDPDPDALVRCADPDPALNPFFSEIMLEKQDFNAKI